MLFLIGCKWMNQHLMCRCYVQKDYTTFATITILNKSLYESNQLPPYIHCWCIGAQQEKFAWIFSVYMN